MGEKRRGRTRVGRARSLTEQAGAMGEGDREGRESKVAVLIGIGALADAMAEADARCAEDPSSFRLQALRIQALTAIGRRLCGPPWAPCPCGSADAYEACCQEAERAALARFEDAADLEELSVMLLNHLAGLEGFTSIADGEWRGVPGPWWRPDGSLPGSEVVLRSIWAAGAIRQAQDVPGGWDLAGDEPTVLDHFASLPDVRSRFGDLIDAWVGSARFGIWQLDRYQPRSGLSVNDLLTGRKLHIAVRDAERGELADPWATFVGGLMLDRGVWRLLPGIAILSPAEADVFVGRALSVTGQSPLDKPSRVSPPGAGYISRSARDTVDARWVPPSLLGEFGRLLTPEGEALLVCAAGVMVPDLLARARRGGRPPAQAAGTAVRVRAVVTAEPNRFLELWEGLESQDGVVALDTARSELWWAGRGCHDTHDWRRRRREGEGVSFYMVMGHGEKPGILIDSRGSLEDAVAFIREVDPSVVLAVATCAPVGAPASWAQGEGVAAADVARWEEEWPDQPAFALECLKPSQAWYCLDGHTLLELALRDLEFHAGRVRGEGRPAPDMALLRERLHMRRKDFLPAAKVPSASRI